MSVALHEGGHFIAARSLKVAVPRFFVGFGKTLWSKEYRGTEFGVKAIPLGGFIDAQDTTQPEDSPERHLLSHVAPWKRQVIFFAGPAVNLVLGIAIIFAYLTMIPQAQASNLVQGVNSCSVAPNNCFASKAGIQPGDRIVGINSAEVHKLSDIKISEPGQNNVVTVDRNGKKVNLNVTSSAARTIGINMATEEGTLGATEAFTVIGSVFEKNLVSLSSIPEKVPNVVYSIAGTEERDPEGLASVVGVGRTYGETASTTKIDDDVKVEMFVLYSGLLNIGLGLVNLLPFMPLDGGRMFVAFIDSIRLAFSRISRRKYSPTAYKYVTAMTAVTGVMVIGFMLLLIVADIVRPLSIY